MLVHPPALRARLDVPCTSWRSRLLVALSQRQLSSISHLLPRQRAAPSEERVRLAGVPWAVLVQLREAAVNRHAFLAVVLGELAVGHVVELLLAPELLVSLRCLDERPITRSLFAWVSSCWMFTRTLLGPTSRKACGASSDPELHLHHGLLGRRCFVAMY